MREQIERVTCDRCKRKDIEGTRTIGMAVARQSNDQDKYDVVKLAELCPDHMKDLLIYTLDRMAMEDRARIFAATTEIEWREELR